MTAPPTHLFDCPHTVIENLGFAGSEDSIMALECPNSRASVSFLYCLRTTDWGIPMRANVAQGRAKMVQYGMLSSISNT